MRNDVIGEKLAVYFVYRRNPRGLCIRESGFKLPAKQHRKMKISTISSKLNFAESWKEQTAGGWPAISFLSDDHRS